MIRPHLPSTVSLRAFEACARLGGCTRAAADLHMTAGAVSKQLKALEDLLGAPLFLRERQGLVLTRQGEAYLEATRVALGALEAAALRVQDAASPRQRLLLHAVPALADRWLLPRFAGFAARHPDIDVQFTPHVGSGGGNEAGPDPEPDIWLRHGDGAWPGCDSWYLTGRRLRLVLSPALLERLGTLRSAADLQRATLLQHFELPGAWLDFFRAHGVRVRALPHTVRYGYFVVLIRGAVTGMGAALIPAALVADELRSGALVNPLGLECRVRAGYYLSVRSARRDEPAIRAFREWALDGADSTPTQPSPCQGEG